jgi:hypothetical protein
LFSTSSSPAADRRQSTALARQTRRDIEQIIARVEVETTAEQARAFITAHALTNVATLVAQAEAHMKIAPAGAPFYEALVTSYAMSAGHRIAKL